MGQPFFMANKKNTDYAYYYPLDVLKYEKLCLNREDIGKVV